MSNVLFLWNPPSIRILRSVYGFEKSNQAFEYAKSLLKALESEHFSLQLLNFFLVIIIIIIIVIIIIIILFMLNRCHYAGIMLDASTTALCP